MPNYEKLTLDRFKLHMKEGKYESLTGARRAIGKATTWSNKEKDTARELADKHFGGAPAKASAAPKKKLAGPKAKKAAKVAAPKKLAKRAAKGTVGHAEAAAPVPERRTPVAAANATDHHFAAHSLLNLVTHGRLELEAFKAMGMNTAKQQEQLFGSFTDAISHLSAVKNGKSVADVSVPRVEVPKPATPAPKPAKAAPKKADEEVVKTETVADVESNGVSDEQLTAAERAAKEVFASSNPGILNLPTPSV